MTIRRIPHDLPGPIDKVPHIPQFTSWDCGLTCLSMVLVALERQNAVRIPPVTHARSSSSPVSSASSSSAGPFHFNFHSSRSQTNSDTSLNLPTAATATVPTPSYHSLWNRISSYYNQSSHATATTHSSAPSSLSKHSNRLPSTLQYDLEHSIFADPSYLRSPFVTSQSVWTIDLAYILRHFGVEDFSK
jgi:hypothetical protein